MLLRTGAWKLHAVRVAGMICLLATSAARAQVAPQLEELLQIQATLSQAVRDAHAVDAHAEPPRDVLLRFQQGLGRGEMELSLRRHGDRWFVRTLQGVPASLGLNPLDVSGLRWEDGRLIGPIVATWSLEDDDQPAANPETPADRTSVATQVFDVNAAVLDTLSITGPRLLLTLNHWHGGEWTIVYRQEGQGWTPHREVRIPRQAAIDTFGREIGPIQPDEAGNFSTHIRLTYAGTDDRLRAEYEQLQPGITLQGQLREGRIDGYWLMQAPGGKGLLGSGRDMLTGWIQVARITGAFRSDGPRGEWMGDLLGSVILVPEDPLASLPAPEHQAPASLADATVQAAQAWRTILALDMALRNHPMPVPDAYSRVMAPLPTWPESATPEAMHHYLDFLLAQARRVLQPPQTPIVGFTTPGQTFGPFQGPGQTQPLEDNRLPDVRPGTQVWRSLTGWRMLGPFPVYDQAAEVHYPQVAPEPLAAYQRQRLFTTREGDVEVVEDAAAWRPPLVEHGMVYPPVVPEASSGSERYFAWYAATQLHSDRAQEVWVSMKLRGQATVWLNGRRVWESGPDFDSPAPAVFPVALQAGENRVLVRCASSPVSNAHFGRVHWFEGHPHRPQGRVSFTHFAMHVCTQGAPGEAPASHAVPSPTATVGYRGDGSGVYPAARPPLAWDLAAGTNVAWQTPLPAGTSEPILLEGRLYLTAEPDLLLCLDADNGQIVWQRRVAPQGAPDAPVRGRRATTAPVGADGQIYVHFGTGVAGRFTADGDPVWVVSTGAPWDHQRMGSPLLVDGRLILQAHLPGSPEGQFGLMALDAATGERLWQTPGPRRRVLTPPYDRADGLGNGVSLMRLTNGRQERAVLITGDGAVVDAADGTLLHRAIFHVEAPRAAPTVHEDVVYIAPAMGQEAVRLWLDDAGRVNARTLWQTPPSTGRGQTKTTTDFGSHHWMAAPLVHDGRMYVVRVDSAHVPQHYVCPWTQLDIYDTATGARLSRMRAILRAATDPTVPPVLAGRYLFVGDGGNPVGGFGGTSGTGALAAMEILSPTAEQHRAVAMTTPTHQGAWGLAALAARSATAPMRAGPVFDGDRMFLRGFEGIACIAVTSPQGQRYQDEKVADITINELVGLRPQTPPTRSIPAMPLAPQDGPVPTPAAAGRSADDWLILGPLPLDGPADILEALGGPEGVRLTTHPPIHASLPMQFTRAYHRHVAADGLDAIGALGERRDCRAYLYTVIQCRTRQTFRYRPEAGVQRAWLNGEEIRPDDLLDLELGYYTLLLDYSPARLPPFVRPKLTPGLARAPRVDDTEQRWTTRIRVLADRLEWIARTLPRSGYARSAGVALRAVGMDLQAMGVDMPDAPTPDPAPHAAAPPTPTTRQAAATQPKSTSPLLWLAMAAMAMAAAGAGAVLLKSRRTRRATR